MVRNSVFLHFEEEKLVHWEAIDPIMRSCSTNPDVHSRTGPWLWCHDVSDPPTCGSIPPPIPTGPQWVFDPSVGRPEPETSCKSERKSAEGRVEAGDTRYVARNYVSLWLEPTPSSNEGWRILVNRGQPLKILGRRCQWCRVEDNVGTKGWVACVFLEANPD